MKINSNFGANIEQQDFQKTTAGESAAGNQSQLDALEKFDPSRQAALDDSAATSVKSDYFAGASLLFGGRNEELGFNIPIDQAFAPPEDTNADSGWFDSFGQDVKDYGKERGGWFGTGLEYLGEGIKDTPEAFNTASLYFGKGILGAIEGMSAAAEGIDTAVKWLAEGAAEGASWVAEQIDDAVTSWATQTADGIVTGAETLGSLVSDALDW